VVQIDCQVTGQNGLIWDSNPAFSDDDSVSSIPRLFQKLHRQREWDVEATEKMPPWLQNDPDVEWVDVVETIDVGVQTDFDDQRSSHYKAQSRSADSNALSSEIGDPSRRRIDLCCSSDGKQLEITSRCRQSCATSSESDTFNNSAAPFWSPAGRKSIRVFSPGVDDLSGESGV